MIVGYHFVWKAFNVFYVLLNVSYQIASVSFSLAPHFFLATCSPKWGMGHFHLFSFYNVAPSHIPQHSKAIILKTVYNLE